MIIDTIGIEAPDGFPVNAYNKVHRVIIDLKYNDSHKDIWKEFAGAWNGIAYRYKTCFECNNRYVASIKTHTDSPVLEERYNQERDIFNFFVNGFSVIECFCYGLFALMSLKDPVNFPLVTPEDKKAVTYSNLLKKIKVQFPNENIVKSIGDLLTSDQFLGWYGVRNILTHRSTPPRHFRAGGERDHQTDWGDIYLNIDTLTIRLEWLSEKLELLFDDTYQFIQNYAK